jgi:hypothetical protein
MKGHKETLAFLVDHMTSTAATVAVGADGGMDTKDKVLWILY